MWRSACWTCVEGQVRGCRFAKRRYVDGRVRRWRNAKGGAWACKCVGGEVCMVGASVVKFVCGEVLMGSVWVGKSVDGGLRRAGACVGKCVCVVGSWGVWVCE